MGDNNFQTQDKNRRWQFLLFLFLFYCRFFATGSLSLEWDKNCLAKAKEQVFARIRMWG